ncbi:uL15 family ribosomal protein [Candidatus Micrarchaeota archaeon]|jgi:large subunit ribosomal protein L15|nr:uL15 family ribosomal protein [Candidatus Micrarchaeota archaeon]
MPIRKNKKNTKYLGNRTHGRGDTKRGRGKGNKGGIGNSGWNKHKWTKCAKNKKQWMHESKGFTTPVDKSLDTINVFKISDMIEKGKIKDSYEFKGKILGSGEIIFPIKIKALSFTEKAKEKIKAAGGSVELIVKDKKVANVLNAEEKPDVKS